MAITNSRRVHLVCNAHIDPVWLWERDEGIAAALSTFRCAADFCEEFDGFVFNHNEALLYEWTEEYEPALFERIRALVRAGKWHIMGGWYLQPDCNLPSGESFVRQILAGRRYFEEKFGVRPTTAINFDPFGHDRGLVQILTGSGFDSYIICRPLDADLALGGNDVHWIGHDGSSVIVHRSPEWYNSALGKAREKMQKTVAERTENPLMILWGVGDHGGGASRGDLRDLAELRAEFAAKGIELVHSDPESYFSELVAGGKSLPSFSGDLRPWAPGCYTSMSLIKRAHRALEDALYGTEKLLAAAVMNGRLPWPQAELADARKDLMFLQFHDILPGSAIVEVEEWSLGLAARARESLGRLRARSLFALASGQRAAGDDEIPILVLNPHPWPVEATVECEFQMADQNWEDSRHLPELFHDGVSVPCQGEKESSTLNLDWRKRIVFRATLAPNGLTRFVCRLRLEAGNPVPVPRVAKGALVFSSGKAEISIGLSTGLLEGWTEGGVSLLPPGAFSVAAFQDDADPWGISPRDYTRERGRFVLATAAEAAKIAGVAVAELAPVRLVEDGPVRSVVEAIFVLGRATMIRRYAIEHARSGIDISDELVWEEADRMLKLLVPTGFDPGAEYRGQGAFCRSELPANGTEAVAQRWVAARSGDRAILVFTDFTYGSDYSGGTIRLNLMRTAAYAAHPILDRPLLPADRAVPRMDRGLRRFTFRVESGSAKLLDSADLRGLERGEKPWAISFFPPGGGKPIQAGCTLESKTGALVLSALKRAETGDGWIVRLYDPVGTGGYGMLRFPALGFGPFPVACGPWGIKTWKLGDDGTFTETDLAEGTK